MLFLLDWAVRAAFLAALAGLVAAIARIHNIRTRLALWSALLSGSLALPAVRPFMPPLLLPRASAAHVSLRAPVILHHVARVTAAPSRIAEPRPSDLSEMALGLWAAGALLLLARLCTGLIFARRVVRAAAPVADKIRHMRGLRVLESVRVNVPLTAGVFRPVVLLPEEWRTWDAERLRAVLAHERSHVERCDGLVRMAARVHRAVLWFSPVAWWLERHLADLAECASDDAALAETADSSAYAAIVLDFCRAGRKRLSIEGLAMAQGGSAERRIDRILSSGPLRTRLKRTTLVAVLALTGGSVALVAALQSQPPAASVPSAAPTAPPIAPAPPSPHPLAVPEPAVAPEPPVAPDSKESIDSWVLFRGDSFLTMGLQAPVDLREAQAMHDRAKRDMIWLRRGPKKWAIQDADLLQRVGDLLRPVEQWLKKDEALNQQREVLNQQQKALSEAMANVRVTMPHLEDELKMLEEQLRVREPTSEQLARLQEQLGAMQDRLGQAQAGKGSREAELSRKMDELARRQDDIRRIQEASGEEQDKASDEAQHMLEKLLDEAVHSGLARPCDPTY
jgi:beta-lactamase regulating signal transducer with metallopeptidase domain